MATTYSDPFPRRDFSMGNGDTEIVSIVEGLPFTVFANSGYAAVGPNPGGNLTVEYTYSTREDVVNNNAVWFNWNPIERDGVAFEGVNHPITAVRFVATGAAEVGVIWN